MKDPLYSARLCLNINFGCCLHGSDSDFINEPQHLK